MGKFKVGDKVEILYNFNESEVFGEVVDLFITKQKEVIDALVESAEYIEALCVDVPDQLMQIPEDKHLSDLISIKKVAKQMIKYAKANSQ